MYKVCFKYSDNIVWLSLMRVTDWLNTLTWLQQNLGCSPPQSCGGGTLIDTTKCFYSGEIFHANKWQNELANILSLQKCMLTALDRALAVYCAHMASRFNIYSYILISRIHFLISRNHFLISRNHFLISRINFWYQEFISWYQELDF